MVIISCNNSNIQQLRESRNFLESGDVEKNTPFTSGETVLFKEVCHLKEQEFSMLSFTCWLFPKLDGKYHMRCRKCTV